MSMKMTQFRSLSDRRFPRQGLSCFLLLLLTFPASAVRGDQTRLSQPDERVRSVLVEVYFRQGDAERAAAMAAIEELKKDRGGITIVLRDTEETPRNQERLDAILRHYKVAQQTSPVIYSCNRVIYDVSKSNSWRSQLRGTLRMEVFVRTGCSHCAAAKQWLPQFMKTYPGLELVYRDISADSASAARLSRIVEQHHTMAASVPVFYAADKLLVGFENERSTGERLQSILKPWTRDAPKVDDSKRLQKQNPAGEPSTTRFLRNAVGSLNAFVATQTLEAVVFQDSEEVVSDRTSAAADEEPELPLPSDDGSKPEDAELALPGSGIDSLTDDETSDHIEVPVLGRLSASKLGMPLFTLAIGLIDGFNPCAMWVLLFLLSILVNLKDRLRIIAIAGTFVVVSGLAYFAFMAAWLNVFALIGYLRPIQIALALMAIVIGLVHVKDFFAFRQGLSLSIPESAKPGIYARVRRIVTAEHMSGAVAGAIVLAILVNIIELLCTAGLPALYTNILMQQGLPAAGRYAYLALYIAAYMIDDTLMVSIVVITLSKRKLQETQGRWLKLISGAAILLLGGVMLFRPEWLH